MSSRPSRSASISTTATLPPWLATSPKAFTEPSLSTPKPVARRSISEFVMVMSGFDVDFDDQNDFYAVNAIPFHYQLHPIQIKVGEKVRIYLVNILEFDLINSFHLHANFFNYYPTGTSLVAQPSTPTRSCRPRPSVGFWSSPTNIPVYICSTPITPSSPSLAGPGISK